MAEPFFDKRYHTLIPCRDEWVDRTPGNRRYVDFYTDGSKLDSQVGLGVYSEDLGLEMALRMPDYCSVYQAEILAIAKVAKWLRCNVLTKLPLNP